MAISENHPKLCFFEEEDAFQDVQGRALVLRNQWWIKHPTRGLVIYTRGSPDRDLSPQCNKDEKVVTMFRDKLYPWAEVVHMDCVILPDNSEY